MEQPNAGAAGRFEVAVEEGLSPETGLWDGHRFSGVREVSLAPDERMSHVKYHDGREELVPLPE